jgi:hypothetical protein
VRIMPTARPTILSQPPKRQSKSSSKNATGQSPGTVTMSAKRPLMNRRCPISFYDPSVEVNEDFVVLLDTLYERASLYKWFTNQAKAGHVGPHRDVATQAFLPGTAPELTPAENVMVYVVDSYSYFYYSAMLISLLSFIIASADNKISKLGGIINKVAVGVRIAMTVLIPVLMVLVGRAQARKVNMEAWLDEHVVTYSPEKHVLPISDSDDEAINVESDEEFGIAPKI